MRMKQPESIDELYKELRILLLYCQLDARFNSYGNLHTSHKYAIIDWGALHIMPNTPYLTSNLMNQIEIPKYAPFNHP